MKNYTIYLLLFLSFPLFSQKQKTNDYLLLKEIIKRYDLVFENFGKTVRDSSYKNAHYLLKSLKPLARLCMHNVRISPASDLLA